MPAEVNLKINKTLTVIIVGKYLLIQVQYSFGEATYKSKKDVSNAVVNYANLLQVKCAKNIEFFVQVPKLRFHERFLQTSTTQVEHSRIWL